MCPSVCRQASRPECSPAAAVLLCREVLACSAARAVCCPSGAAVAWTQHAPWRLRAPGCSASGQVCKQLSSVGVCQRGTGALGVLCHWHLPSPVSR